MAHINFSSESCKYLVVNGLGRDKNNILQSDLKPKMLGGAGFDDYNTQAEVEVGLMSTIIISVKLCTSQHCPTDKK